MYDRESPAVLSELAKGVSAKDAAQVIFDNLTANEARYIANGGDSTARQANIKKSWGVSEATATKIMADVAELVEENPPRA